MRLCLLGGTAFLGKYIAEAGLAAGHEVTCVARGTSGPVPKGARHLVLDRSQLDALSALNEESFDAVVELTWQPCFAREALAALSDKSERWCFVSSVSAYADHDVPEMDESTQLLDPLDGDDATIEFYGEAKVACEQATILARGSRCLILRPGLIGGPGDVSDRSGAWVARCAQDPTAPLLVPRSPSSFVQVIDGRDLAEFIVVALTSDLVGTFNTVGESVAFSEFVALSRSVGGHTGEVRQVDWPWLKDRGVQSWAGPQSMACFVAEAVMAGWGSVNGETARSHGLNLRSLEATITDTLADEKLRGLGRARRAGLSLDRERQLLAQFSLEISKGNDQESL